MYQYFAVLLFSVVLMFSEKVALFLLFHVSRNRNKPFHQNLISDLQKNFRKSGPNKGKCGLTVFPKSLQNERFSGSNFFPLRFLKYSFRSEISIKFWIFLTHVFIHILRKKMLLIRDFLHYHGTKMRNPQNKGCK